jgi:ABC-2 type transport system ATP-binding protein
MNHIVEIENLTKDYEVGFWKKRKVRALDNLNLQVEPGQIFGFLGGNGAGENDDDQILMSLLFASSGSARILGSDIADVKMRSRIGYCPENPYFYDYLKASELMNYFGELFGLDAARRKRKTEELLTKVGLDEKDWNKQLRKFSKGMLQRVGTRAEFNQRTGNRFFDEPMSGLDPIGRREIRELIAELREKGTTVFMSTHILSDIEALCDNVAISAQGKLAATGKLDDLLTASGEQQSFEINVKNISAELLQNEISIVTGASVYSKPNGANIHVSDENDIEKILRNRQKIQWQARFRSSRSNNLLKSFS